MGQCGPVRFALFLSHRLQFKPRPTISQLRATDHKETGQEKVNLPICLEMIVNRTHYLLVNIYQ